MGIDHREVDFSKNGVCKLVTKQGGESFCSTGFVIDSHIIATAAHCVYDVVEANSTKVSSKTEIEHILFFNGNEQVVKRLSSENVTGVHVPNNFWRSNQPLYFGISDYALITVNIDLSNYLVFNLGFPMDHIKDHHPEVYTTGFPEEVNGEKVNNTIIGGPYAKHAAYTSVGTIMEMNYIEIVNDIYISAGNSGGPVYLSSTYNGKVYYTVIGIVNGMHPDGNDTYRMTTDVLHFFKNNPNL